MNNAMIFSFPGNQQLAHDLAKKMSIEEGRLTLKHFPDGESYVRIDSMVKDKIVILYCTLHHPDKKILPLMFAAKTLKELGAKKIILLSPYLSYMRQDKRFHEGEAVSAPLFASLISQWVDFLVTIDPHLHRIHQLSEIFSIPTLTLHANDEIAQWIHQNIKAPYLIGPDSESEQWVSAIAHQLNAPYLICKKIRLSAHDVKIDIPYFSATNKTLVLMDDMISTGSSMLTILKQLSSQGYSEVVCLAVHPLLKMKTKADLLAAGASCIMTCDTIQDSTNNISLLDLMAKNLEKIIDTI